MDVSSQEKLVQKRCVPCEGGVEACPVDVATRQVNKLDGWKLTENGERIRKDWSFPNYVKSMDFLNQVTVVAESEAHHPDVHLESYKNVWIEIWTHAIGGLSENDFILAAKIDAIPPQ